MPGSLGVRGEVGVTSPVPVMGWWLHSSSRVACFSLPPPLGFLEAEAEAEAAPGGSEVH